MNPKINKHINNLIKRQVNKRMRRLYSDAPAASPNASTGTGVPVTTGAPSSMPWWAQGPIYVISDPYGTMWPTTTRYGKLYHAINRKMKAANVTAHKLNVLTVRAQSLESEVSAIQQEMNSISPPTGTGS